MAAVLKGNLDIRQTHRESTWDDLNGWTTTVKYRGRWSDIQVASETALYVGGASRITATQNGDQAQDGVLVVSFAAKSQAEALSSAPDVNEFSNEWTLGAAEEEIEVWKHQNFRGLARISGESGYVQRILLDIDEWKKKVAAGITNNTANKDLNFSSVITKKGTTAQQALADNLVELLLEGQETEGIDRYSLRNVRVVPGNSDITASHAKTRFMWSNDRMVDLIASGATQSALIGDIAGSFAGTYWYKLAPSIESMNNGRYQIVTEWVNFQADEFNEILRPIFD